MNDYQEQAVRSKSDRFFEGSPCRRCGNTTRYRIGRSCVPCVKLRNSKASEAFTDARLLRTFGITLSQYQAMWEAQEGRCAICGSQGCPTGKDLAVDHDHKTGMIRGLLCSGCNTGIGGLKDDPERLYSAIKYLESFNV